MKTINFELQSPILYANGSGQNIECSFIELREPTGKISHVACQVEGIIQTSIMKMSEQFTDEVIEKAKEGGSEINEVLDGDSMISVITSSGADMEKLVLLFRELFKVVAWMGGEKPITAARMDDLNHKDLRKMIGVYTANFILN